MHEFQEFGALLWQALKPWFVNLGAAFVIYLVGLVIVFAKAKVQELKSDLLRSLITQGVYAAEQLYNSGDGKKKFEYVQQFLEDRRVYGVDKGLIESEVYWLSKHEKKQDATPAPLEAA